MPIYEYRCRECGEKTEILVLAGSSSATCPSCGSPLLEKLFSAPYVMSGQTARPQGRTCCGQEERCSTPPCSTERGCTRR
ncbi:MAG TPA: zinc ribbon domain-containing protein [Chloroflexi bacterium]|nr:zinc ribbon domain-containing protein [Chloroflexota bacterium]